MTLETTSARHGHLSSSRYELLVKIATGGMASVYVARRVGGVRAAGLVAVKRAHPHLLEDPASRRELVAEATLASRVHHPNVVAIHDIEQVEGEILLVMDYVEGGSLAELLAAAHASGSAIPPGVALRIALDASVGLQAVHEAPGDDGKPSGLVHRDVSPQNILVDLRGIARLADFGVARPVGSYSATTSGVLRGKAAYLSPEYIAGRPCTPQSDLFAMGVVVWEALTSQRLFLGSNEAATLQRIAQEPAPAPSTFVPALGAEIDAIVGQALEKVPARRQRSVGDLASALEQAARRRGLLATQAEVGALVQSLVGGELARRREVLRVRTTSSAEDGASETVSLVREGEGADVDPVARAVRNAVKRSDEAARRGAEAPHREEESPRVTASWPSPPLSNTPLGAPLAPLALAAAIPDLPVFSPDATTAPLIRAITTPATPWDVAPVKVPAPYILPAGSPGSRAPAPGKVAPKKTAPSRLALALVGAAALAVLIGVGALAFGLGVASGASIAEPAHRGLAAAARQAARPMPSSARPQAPGRPSGSRASGGPVNGR